ncbi:MAG: hypothetical protein H7Y03_03065 [Chitinophagaceae bacterium]|nr:hypothetical protein [Chitinophagaceae bacterium]
MLIDFIFFVLIILAILKGYDKGFLLGIGLYLLLYLLIYTFILYYAREFGILTEERLAGSRTYKYIISWGMKAIEALRNLFP